MSRYVAIADALRRQILGGTYAPLAQLPSQRELAKSMGTTLMTVRQAIDVLRDAGLLQSQHGQGTFVADIGRLDSFSEVMAARGLMVVTKILGISASSGSRSARVALGLPPEERIAAITRLRLVSGTPVAVQRSYVPSKYAAALHSYDGSMPLYVQLRQRAGVVATSYRESLSCRVLTESEVRQLQVPPDSIAFESRRTSFSDGASPVVYDEALLPSQRISLTIIRRGRAFDVSYEPVPGLLQGLHD